jgi:glycosyltransferase involved in cell wall biosynthesis
VHDLKISLITVTYNAEKTIGRCIRSVINQNFKNVEYIVIDGGSTDNTSSIINQYASNVSHFISEPDNGIYDAMNKGIRQASGDVVGMLNADDFFADNSVLSLIADAFTNNNIDATYGDLDYINENGRVIRHWRSGQFVRRKLRFGWMPPHPTFYCKRYLFEKFGFYRLDYGTAADFELMIRYLYAHEVTAFYINHVLIKMRTGGKSNNNLISRLKGLFFDLRAMRHNQIPIPFLAIIAKPMRKINQYLNLR